MIVICGNTSRMEETWDKHLDALGMLRDTFIRLSCDIAICSNTSHNGGDLWGLYMLCCYSRVIVICGNTSSMEETWKEENVDVFSFFAWHRYLLHTSGKCGAPCHDLPRVIAV